MNICATCAVEYDELPAVCRICADERQYVPEGGQRWVTMEELAAAGQQLTWDEVEPGRVQVTTAPKVGIGQTAQVVTTAEGSLVWDPPGYVDDDTAARIAKRGPVLAIAASHPHMFGVQVEWSRRLGDVPVLVAETDREWLGRNDSAVEFWSGSRTIADGLALHQVGGHFAGSAVAHWSGGAGGRGLLLTGDTVFPTADRRSVGFMRSYPNYIPLSGAVVQRLVDQLSGWQFDAMVGNFGNQIAHQAHDVLRTSADRHIRWARGDFDHLT